jgi:hypothetical protein
MELYVRVSNEGSNAASHSSVPFTIMDLRQCCFEVLSTSASSSLSGPASHVTLESIPTSISATWVQPPLGTPGPETAPVPAGPTLATLHNAATGQQVDRILCQTGEQTVVHVHTQLTIFANGQARVIPYGIGIPGHEHSQSGAPILLG